MESESLDHTVEEYMPESDTDSQHILDQDDPAVYAMNGPEEHMQQDPIMQHDEEMIEYNAQLAQQYALNSEYYQPIPMGEYTQDMLFGIGGGEYDPQQQQQQQQAPHIYHVPTTSYEQDPATMIGFVGSTIEALLIFQACVEESGPLSQKIIGNRLTKNQRQMIRSGSIFVFYEDQSSKGDKNSTGIKRWTDGKNWSPSRIEGNFLVYSELESKMDRQGGIKKKIKKNEIASEFDVDDSMPLIPTALPDAPVDDESSALKKPSRPIHPDAKVLSKGAFVISKEGLQKKSISVTLDNGQKVALLCYYKQEDIDRFQPITDIFKDLIVSEMLMNQQFRKPIFEPEKPEPAPVECNFEQPKAKKESKKRSSTGSVVKSAPRKRKSRSKTASPALAIVGSDEDEEVNGSEALGNDTENCGGLILPRRKSKRARKPLLANLDLDNSSDETNIKDGDESDQLLDDDEEDFDQQHGQLQMWSKDMAAKPQGETLCEDSFVEAKMLLSLREKGTDGTQEE